jgi:hypothetical protein
MRNVDQLACLTSRNNQNSANSTYANKFGLQSPFRKTDDIVSPNRSVNMHKSNTFGHQVTNQDKLSSKESNVSSEPLTNIGHAEK